MIDVYINVWIGPDGKPWNEAVFMNLNDAAEDIIDFEDGLGKRGHSYWTTLVRSETHGCYEISEEHMRRHIRALEHNEGDAVLAGAVSEIPWPKIPPHPNAPPLPKYDPEREEELRLKYGGMARRRRS